VDYRLVFLALSISFCVYLIWRYMNPIKLYKGIKEDKRKGDE